MVRSKLDVGDVLVATLRMIEDDVPTCIVLAKEDVAAAGCQCEGAVDPRAQYGSMRECVLLSLHTIQDYLRRRYMQLAVFGKDVVISSDVLAVVWGVSPEVARSECNMLLDRHLVTRAQAERGVRDGARRDSENSEVHVILHDLQRVKSEVQTRGRCALCQLRVLSQQQPSVCASHGGLELERRDCTSVGRRSRRMRARASVDWTHCHCAVPSPHPDAGPPGLSLPVLTNHRRPAFAAISWRNATKLCRSVLCGDCMWNSNLKVTADSENSAAVRL